MRDSVAFRFLKKGELLRELPGFFSPLEDAVRFMTSGALSASSTAAFSLLLLSSTGPRPRSLSDDDEDELEADLKNLDDLIIADSVQKLSALDFSRRRDTPGIISRLSITLQLTVTY